MLYHCIQAGMDMAIVNPAHITAYPDIPQEEKDLAEDLIFNRRADALQRYIEYYETVTPAEQAGAVDPTKDMTPEQRLHWKILHRHKDGVEADIDEIINRTDGQVPVPTKHEIAVHTLNNVLLPAMKEVGDKFGAGELILPFVLQSAEVMKKTVAHLENYLEKVEGVTKGTVVIATVYGDVHDIGKNLVKTILANNGYTVIDLGKQVPAETIITKAVEVNATAIGLSALLVSTSKQMPLIVNELHRRGLGFPVLVGGAAINRRFGRRILFTEDGKVYDPGVFYCKDAFEGLETMDQLIVPVKREELLNRVRREGDLEMGRTSQVPEHRKAPARSRIQPEPVQHPLKWGQRVVKDMPLEIVLKHLSLNELYRLSWGAKNAHGAEWDKLKAEFDERLEKMTKEALRYKWLKPQGVYGLYPCQSDDDDLIIYHPDTVNSASPDELQRFAFRQIAGRPRLHGSLLYPRTRRPGRRGHCRLSARTYPSRAGYRRKPGQALFLGLSCHSRAGGSQESVRATARRGNRAGHDAFFRLPINPRAIHCCDYRASQRRQVLQRR
jgi:5-methyltetrahydrofolate--homocysteine methyltransferase